MKAYDEHGGRWPDHHEQALFQAVKAARTALAQPEPEGPTEKQVMDLADDCAFDRQEISGFDGGRTFHDHGWECTDAQLVTFATALITRYAHPTIEPVPAPMSADTLAAIIREVDGTHRLGAAALAEAILAHPAAINARPAPVPVAEPEGPTDEDLMGLDDLRDAWNAQADAVNSWDELGIDEIIWFAQQQALARWGTPAIQPVPVAERLPGPEDCDEDGFCWFWNLQWERWRAGWQDDECTHWLPHHAMPIPTP